MSCLFIERLGWPRWATPLELSHARRPSRHRVLRAGAVRVDRELLLRRIGGEVHLGTGAELRRVATVDRLLAVQDVDLSADDAEDLATPQVAQPDPRPVEVDEVEARVQVVQARRDLRPAAERRAETGLDERRRRRVGELVDRQHERHGASVGGVLPDRQVDVDAVVRQGPPVAVRGRRSGTERAVVGAGVLARRRGRGCRRVLAVAGGGRGGGHEGDDDRESDRRCRVAHCLLLPSGRWLKSSPGRGLTTPVQVIQILPQNY